MSIILSTIFFLFIYQLVSAFILAAPVSTESQSICHCFFHAKSLLTSPLKVILYKSLEELSLFKFDTQYSSLWNKIIHRISVNSEKNVKNAILEMTKKIIHYVQTWPPDVKKLKTDFEVHLEDMFWV